MKTLMFVAAMFVSTAVMAEDQCVPALTAKSLEAGCVHIQMPADAEARLVITSSVDPRTVSAMPPLPQVDTVVREVVVAE